MGRGARPLHRELPVPPVPGFLGPPPKGHNLTRWKEASCQPGPGQRPDYRRRRRILHWLAGQSQHSARGWRTRRRPALSPRAPSSATCQASSADPGLRPSQRRYPASSSVDSRTTATPSTRRRTTKCQLQLAKGRFTAYDADTEILTALAATADLLRWARYRWPHPASGTSARRATTRNRLPLCTRWLTRGVTQH